MRVRSYMSEISLAVLEHGFSFKALVCNVFFGLLWFRAASEREPDCFFFCFEIKSSMAVAELSPIDAVCCMEVIDSLVCVCLRVGVSLLSATVFGTNRVLSVCCYRLSVLGSWLHSGACVSVGGGLVGTSPVTHTRITLSQRCFSSSLSAAKLWTDFDWDRRKLAGGSAGREASSTE